MILKFFIKKFYKFARLIFLHRSHFFLRTTVTHSILNLDKYFSLKTTIKWSLSDNNYDGYKNIAFNTFATPRSNFNLVSDLNTV